jgi:aldehyde dehydrogenase (NAD+)
MTKVEVNSIQKKMFEIQGTTTVEIKTKSGSITQPTGLFINNTFVPGSSSIETVDPRSGKVICSVMAAGNEDVDMAVNAAAAALPGWKKVTPSERGLLLFRLAGLIERDADTFAHLESLDNGMLSFPDLLYRFSSLFCFSSLY